MSDFPPVPAALLDALVARFPDRLPPLDTPEREVHARIGEQRIISFLRTRLEQQNENVLANPVLNDVLRS